MAYLRHKKGGFYKREYGKINQNEPESEIAKKNPKTWSVGIPYSINGFVKKTNGKMIIFF